MQIKYYFLTCFLLFSFLWGKTTAQSNIGKNAADIKLALEKMNVLGSVLYIAAHPDDENTRLITYLAKAKGFNTTYLSLTRGDGGQNLIGKEVREQLGIIRTQELLAARRVDGGEQTFTRANDFGYSKTHEETFTIWNKEKVLSDAVWAIRKYKPDVIITRFSPNTGSRRTHGHHTASAIIALESFEISGDKNHFSEQLKYTEVWKAKRILWNTSWWFYGTRDFDKTGLISVDVGGYNSLLGKNYGEISSISRSKHKSQGFGSALQRGKQIEYLQYLSGDSAINDIFEGIDCTWSRVEGGGKVEKMIKKANKTFDFTNPAASIPKLINIYNVLSELPKDFWVDRKKKELEEIIWQCAGLWADATHKEYNVTPGDSLHLNLRLIKRSDINIKLYHIGFISQQITIDSLLPNNILNTFNQSLLLPEEIAFTQPYWLTEKESKGMFKVKDQRLIGLPENPPTLNVNLVLEIGNLQKIQINKTISVLYRWNDPVDGERYRPLEIRPYLTANLKNSVYLFSDDRSKKIGILMKAHKTGVHAKISFQVPEGWSVVPQNIDLDFKQKYDEQALSLTLIPPQKQSVGILSVNIETEGKKYSHALTTIDYPHISIQTLFPSCQAKLVKVDIKTEGKDIGYIMGAGDALPEALREVGYHVDILNNKDVNLEKLSNYDAIILGVRAYNTNKRLKYHQPILMDYVKNGGNLIVQYNTSFRLATENIGPYPMKISRDRVTVEEAPVKILNSNHVLLNYPNKITAKDFEGWVQERGLYFPNEWDDRYEAILSSHDPNEDPKQGGLLTAYYGKGTFIYTGYSWFRQMPAGVPGAYRLFANMIAFKQ